MVVICAEWRRIENRHERKERETNKYSRIQESRKKGAKTYFLIRSRENSILKHLRMANGGMYGEEKEEEKKYSWLEKKIAIKAKKGMYIRLQESVSFVQTIS
jgi:hypothetical protein